MAEDLGALLALAGEVERARPEDRDAPQAHLDSACGAFIRELLRDGGDPGEIIPYLTADIDALADQPGVDPQALRHLRETLLARFAGQARRNATRRAIWAAIPGTLLVLAAIAYFSWYFLNLIPVTQPIDTREGLMQRAAVFVKIRRYDGWHQEAIVERRLHAALSFALWPIRPTDAEVDGAREFAVLTERFRQQIAATQGCDSSTAMQERVFRRIAGEYGQNGDDAVASVRRTARDSFGLPWNSYALAAGVRDPHTQWRGTPLQTLAEIVRKSECMDLGQLQSPAPAGAPR